MKYIQLDHYPFEYTVNFGDESDAGMDLRSAAAYDIQLKPGEDYVFPTGLKIHIASDETPLPEHFGLFGMIVPRSGLGFKHYTRLANTAGIIDSEYKGEIMVKIRNEGDSDLTIKRGERMCQMIFTPYLKRVNLQPVNEFDGEDTRGAGFGSSGRM